MSENNDLKVEQAEALRDLETLIGKPIPQPDIKKAPFGVKINGDHVTELRLDGQILGKLGLKKLTMAPESIGNLTSLRLLFLRDHNLITIPESIGNLTSLRYLSFRSNRLETIPESIGNLKFLKILHLENNPLKSIPESIGNLKSLKELYLSGTKLTMLPESIGNLSSLRYLSLGNNQLTTLPESIGNLSSLRTLLLGKNRLEVLPETIGNLKSLKVLYLGGNNLTTLPESFKNLTSLKSLFLGQNKIKELPKSVIQLKSLHTLRWDDRLWVEAPITYKASVEGPSPPINLRSTVMSDLKKVLPLQKIGNYLQKPDIEETRAREIEKKKRIEELKEVEKALKKSQQVKFLVNIAELEDIKRYAQISHQTQSEFIRNAIWDKIRLIDAQSQENSLRKQENIQENKLSLEELKKIRNALERLEKKENQ